MLIPNEMVANFPILRELAHIISYKLWYDKVEHTYSWNVTCKNTPQLIPKYISPPTLNVDIVLNVQKT